MSTLAFAAVAAIPKRIGELRSLIAHAKIIEATDEGLYNSICRASSVLMAAQLEGFVKDLYKGVVDDFNYGVSDFSKRPVAMQVEFCRQIAYYEGVPESDINSRIKALRNFFAVNPVQIQFGHFSYRESQNKNPGAGAVNSIFNKLGVPDVVSSIAGSYFEDVFRDDSHAAYRVARECIRGRSRLFIFPYRKSPSSYSIVHRKKPAVDGLWGDYLEGIMMRRHAIAHGDTFENSTTWENLARDCNKMDAFMHALAFSVSDYLSTRK
ncbi:TPA: hypothetical protein UMY79_002665 [Stenotrophomonas maltophilia]|uniref:HEPN domain-containing protein n=1 Tax=Stenotrophomonas maltophilia TaxID=40324 RepID=A0AAJ2JA96_STEMA|nr:HEPN domain-containing protein [Stenotrophomonas maltophilia]MDT3468258.1 HEPN domain-containing protein [Stenotrophomonas maltophilia]HEL3815768.1 hypothetical protein [Stenotrophomonas maltophilia]